MSDEKQDEKQAEFPAPALDEVFEHHDEVGDPVNVNEWGDEVS